MKLVMAYTKLYSIELIRNRTAAFFTLLFPSLLMLMLGSQHNTTGDILGSAIVFCNYAVQTIAFQVLGMNISMSRNSDWSLYLRTLPVSPLYLFAGRILSMFMFVIISMLLVVALNIYAHNVELSIAQWLTIIGIALLGGIPMALLGIALGYAVNASAARAVFVLVNLGLLFGAFGLPAHGFGAILREGVITYEWLMLSVTTLMGPFTIKPWLWMGAYTVLFYFLALWAYHHRRNLRFE